MRVLVLVVVVVVVGEEPERRERKGKGLREGGKRTSRPMIAVLSDAMSCARPSSRVMSPPRTVMSTRKT